MKYILLFTLFPFACVAQNCKDLHNRYREIGATAGLSKDGYVYGVHYSWNGEAGANTYFGYGIEVGKNQRNEKLGMVGFRLGYHPSLEGLRPVVYLAVNYVLSQPDGMMLEGGGGLAWVKWQLTAAYRRYPTGEEDATSNRGLFLRLSWLITHPANH